MDQTLIKRYLQGMASLYGAIPEDEALEIIRTLETEPLTALELTLLDLDDTFVVRYDDVLAHEAIESEEELEDLLDWQDDKPFYIPDRATLLRYGDGFYTERPPAYEALCDFLAVDMGLEPGLAEEICADLQGYSIISDLEPADVPFEFARRKIPLKDAEKADRLMALVRDLERSTRQWVNRGYTFDEMPDPDFEFPEEEWAYDPDSLLLDALVALVNLYGIVPLALAANAGSRFCGRPVGIDEIGDMDLTMEGIVTQDGQLVAADLAEDPDWFDELVEAQDGKPFFMPEADILIQYADVAFFEETPQYERLRAFLQKRWFPDAVTADDVSAEIVLICRYTGFSMDSVLDWLEENGVRIESDRIVRELTPLVSDVANHSRTWADRGHTPAEIKALMAAGRVPKDAGRNDLCPCGSGLKYKNCCGKQTP